MAWRGAKIRPRSAVGALCAAAVLAPAAVAQKQPTLLDLALLWARGDYRAPIVCQLENGPRRVARRVLIKPLGRAAHRPIDEVVFIPLSLPGSGGRRCFTELGAPEPDVEGTLQISLSGHERPDLARADFARVLKREGGFDFEILSGRLQVRRPEDEAPKEVDLAGGRAHLVRVARGSDAGRLLREFGDVPKRTLTLEAKDGTRLVFHLVQTGPR